MSPSKIGIAQIRQGLPVPLPEDILPPTDDSDPDARRVRIALRRASLVLMNMRRAVEKTRTTRARIGIAGCRVYEKSIRNSLPSVMLPPGRARLATIPSATGSAALAMTIGMVR